VCVCVCVHVIVTDWGAFQNSECSLLLYLSRHDLCIAERCSTQGTNPDLASSPWHVTLDLKSFRDTLLLLAFICRGLITVSLCVRVCVRACVHVGACVCVGLCVPVWLHVWLRGCALVHLFASVFPVMSQQIHWELPVLVIESLHKIHGWTVPGSSWYNAAACSCRQDKQTIRCVSNETANANDTHWHTSTVSVPIL